MAVVIIMKIKLWFYNPKSESFTQVKMIDALDEMSCAFLVYMNFHWWCAHGDLYPM